MSNVAEQLMSLDEFLAWERDQPERYEYASGVITMMTGGSAAHVTIAMNLAFALRHALRGTGCRPFGSDMKVIANHTVRYPDISVICRPVGDRDDHLSDPVLIIEVISPSTEREDRGRKKFDYFATPSIRQYAIIEQNERLIDLYTRIGDLWTDEIVEADAVLKLSSIGVEMSLDVIYEDTELDATRPREGERQIPAG
jgi:Uma2 family endonuclease